MISHNALFKKVETNRNYIFEEAQRNGLVTKINFLNLCKRVYCIFKDFIHMYKHKFTNH